MYKSIMGRKFVLHILLPALAPVIFFGVVHMPLEMMASRTRGMLLLAIAFLGAIAALSAGVAAVKGRLWGGENTAWWAATSIILAIPAIALSVLA